jgi:HPt (histidine-containing phosphotransfer) domain-containing protein/anti-sigma regulatory factor (Ser/Thr protein kinase)
LHRLFLGVLLMLSSFGLMADSLETVLQKAEDALLADPNETLRLVEGMRSGMKMEQQTRASIQAHVLAARASSLLGNSDQILHWAEPVRAAAEKLNSPDLLVKLYCVLGEGYEFSASMQKALEHYELALTVAEKSRDPWLTAYALNFLGWMYNRKLEEKQAMQHIQRAYTIMKNLPHDDLYHDLLNNLGSLYGNKLLGRDTESFRLLEDAKSYFVAQKKHFYASVILYNLGLSLKTNKPKEALEAFREALRSAEAIQDESSIAYCRYGLGLTYSLLNQFQESEHEFLKADEGFIRTNNTMMSNEVQKHLMITYTSAEQFEKALALLPKAEAGMRNFGAPADLITILEQKIMIMNALGRKDEELATYREFGRLSHDYQIQQDRETINKYTVEFDLERKEHEREILENQNRIQSVELEKADRTRKLLLGVAVLSLIIIVLGIRSHLKDREMRRQKKRMQEILDSIQEGILRFGPDFLVEKHYSRHLLELLDRSQDLSGRNVFDLLIAPSELSLDEKSQIRDVLQSVMGEGQLAWELNSSHLPSELSLVRKILGLHWEPLWDRNGHLHKIQLILRDMTESRQLEKDVAAEKARLDVWLNRLQQLLSQDFKRAVRFLKDVSHNLNAKASVKELMRDLHTIKGNARTLGLKTLAEAAHQWESALIQADEIEQKKQEQGWRDEMEAWKPLMETMGLLGDPEPRYLIDVLRDIIPNLQNLLAANGLTLDELIIKDQYQQWTPGDLERLRILFLHGLTNALDHGYILPRQRGDDMPAARLAIEVTRDDSHLQVLLRDFGRGLDWNKIQAIAAEKNFRPREGRPLSDVLFLSGTSTSDKVSATSGRGVGLDVIADTCEKLGGELALLDNDCGPGTRLIMRWPLPALALSA